jgi:hypothetical protein
MMDIFKRERKKEIKLIRELFCELIRACLIREYLEGWKEGFSSL